MHILLIFSANDSGTKHFFFRQMKFRFETALGPQASASECHSDISGGPRAQKRILCGLIKFPGGDEETAGTGNAKTQTDGVKGVVDGT